MNIYKNGYNLDNIDAFLNAERQDDLVNDFFQYSTSARDAYMESLYESISDFDRSNY